MFRYLCSVIVVFVFFLSAASQKLSYYKSALTGDTIRYVVYYPENYTPEKKFPLLLFLHGMSEKTWPVGSFNPKVRTVGLPKLLEAGLKIPFVVIVPNCAYADWDNIGYTPDFKSKLFLPGAWPVEIARVMQQKYAIDTARVYITGISMGGGGTFSALHHYPGVFAAGIPIAGWGDAGKACQTITPLWAFQGSKNNGQSIKSIVESIHACRTDSPSRATILEGKGHVIWDEVYANKASEGNDIYQWLLRFSK